MKWTNVVDGLPPMSDPDLGYSNEVMCQDIGGNTFRGYVRHDIIDCGFEPQWTESGSDMYTLDDIVRWVLLSDVLKILDETSGQTSVRFERGVEDKIGPVLGPFEWVQLTYNILRAKLPDQEEEIELACIEEDEWVHDGCVWSDVVIFTSDPKGTTTKHRR